jgi:hypothetical protein
MKEERAWLDSESINPSHLPSQETSVILSTALGIVTGCYRCRGFISKFSFGEADYRGEANSGPFMGWLHERVHQ